MLKYCVICVVIQTNTTPLGRAAGSSKHFKTALSIVFVAIMFRKYSQISLALPFSGLSCA